MIGLRSGAKSFITPAIQKVKTMSQAHIKAGSSEFGYLAIADDKLKAMGAWDLDPAAYATVASWANQSGDTKLGFQISCLHASAFLIKVLAPLEMESRSVLRKPDYKAQPSTFPLG